MGIVTALCAILSVLAVYNLIFKVNWYPGDRQAEAIRDRMLDEYEERMKQYEVGQLDLGSPESVKLDQLLEESRALRAEVAALKNKSIEPNEQEQP